MNQPILKHGAIDMENGEHVSPFNAQKTRSYKCPCCNESAIFAKGQVIPPYFRHKAFTSECTYYTKESQEHLEAKQYIASLLERHDTTIEIERICKSCGMPFGFSIEPLDPEMRIVQEHSFTHNGGRCRADIAVVSNSGEIELIIEICKTNPTHCEKRPEPWFEFDAATICDMLSSPVSSEKISLKCIRDTFVGGERYHSTCEKCVETTICSGPLGKIYFNQRGAGCGKTYESIQLLASSQFIDKTTFIYLTKMRSAAAVIYGELMSQIQRRKLGNTLEIVEDIATKSHRRITLLIDGIHRTVIIGTIDSFTYAIRNKNSDYFGGNMFEQIVRDIGEGIMSNVESEVSYAHIKLKLTEKYLFIIDEAQDLEKEYLEAFTKVIDKTGIDTYIIGDKLQSILKENNLFTYVEGIDDPRIIKDASKNVNVVKRFHNPEFMPFVNSVVPFAKYDLPEITGVCDGDCAYSHDVSNDPLPPIEIDFQFPNIYSFNKDELDEQLQKITDRMRILVTKSGYLPSNFCFIMPIVNDKNQLLSVLEPHIQNFWHDIFSSPETYSDILLENMHKENDQTKYWSSKMEYREDDGNVYKYIYWHRSEGNQPINLNESKYASRILSIHSSKGTGCECVFFLGLSQQSLCCFTGGIPNTLVYDSLLHVGLTRQKKYIYVGIDKREKNDIYHRFKKISSAEESDAEPGLTGINNRMKLSQIGENILANTNDALDILELIDGDKYLQYLTERSSKDAIDWGHHVVRCSVLRANTHKYLLSNKIDQHGQQLFAMHSTLVKSTELRYVPYASYSQLRYDLKKTIGENSKNERKTKSGLVVPLLIFYEGRAKSDYAVFRTAIQSFCESVIDKLSKRNLCFCPIECIVYCYLLDMIRNPFELSVGIMNIYEILYYYRDFYTKTEFDQELHTSTYGCKCNLHFASSRVCTLSPNTKIKNAIMNHYLSVERIDKIMRSYDETVKTMTNGDHIDYKIDHKTFLGNDITLRSKCYWVGFSKEKDFIVYAVTCPQLTIMNIHKIVVELFLTHCVEIINRDAIPTILFAIIHLDSETPLFINFADILSDAANILKIKQELKQQIEQRYSSSHKRIYDFFDYHRDRDRKDMSEIEHMLKLLNDKILNNKQFPEYIAGCFESIDQEYQTAKKTRRNEIRTGLKDVDWVVTKLDERLEYVANKMLRIPRDDDESDDE